MITASLIASQVVDRRRRSRSPRGVIRARRVASTSSRRAGRSSQSGASVCQTSGCPLTRTPRSANQRAARADARCRASPALGLEAGPVERQRHGVEHVEPQRREGAAAVCGGAAERAGPRPGRLRLVVGEPDEVEPDVAEQEGVAAAARSRRPRRGAGRPPVDERDGRGRPAVPVSLAGAARCEVHAFRSHARDRSGGKSEAAARVGRPRKVRGGLLVVFRQTVCCLNDGLFHAT